MAGSRKYYYIPTWAHFPWASSSAAAPKSIKMFVCAVLFCSLPNGKNTEATQQKKLVRLVFLLVILSCRFEIRQLFELNTYIFFVLFPPWNCTSKQINWMYAIKTADIVLFGGCNQLNMTHTKAWTRPREEERERTRIKNQIRAEKNGLMGKTHWKSVSKNNINI